jgi:hypothetical protein
MRGSARAAPNEKAATDANTGATHCRHGVLYGQEQPSRLTAGCRPQSANDISIARHRIPMPTLAKSHRGG